MSYAIATQSLSYSFGHGRKVVDDLSLEVPQGVIYGFLGPNGAGKTTTIRLLTGMLLSDKENIFINGQSLKKSIPEIFKNIGTLIETPSLYMHLTAKENLSIIATLRSLERKRIHEVLDIVGLARVAHRKAGQFSLGMKQRLGIAMALLPNPQLLILDEPANGLDPQGIIEIRELLIQLNRQEGKTIFVSSHLLHEVEKTCTHIGIIHLGKLQYQGSLDALKLQAYHSGELVFKILNAAAWLPKIADRYTDVRQTGNEEVILPYQHNDQIVKINQQLVQIGVPIIGMQVKGGLEDWFIDLIKKDKQIV